MACGWGKPQAVGPSRRCQKGGLAPPPRRLLSISPKRHLSQHTRRGDHGVVGEEGEKEGRERSFPSCPRRGGREADGVGGGGGGRKGGEKNFSPPCPGGGWSEREGLGGACLRTTPSPSASPLLRK